MPSPGFNGNVPHHLRAGFQGERLTVDLDGRRLNFRLLGSGSEGTTVRLAGSGGNNHGTVGVGFASQPRGTLGGQRVDNLVLRTNL